MGTIMVNNNLIESHEMSDWESFLEPEVQETDPIDDVNSWPYASREHYVNSLGHAVTEVRIIRKKPHLVNEKGWREWHGKIISGYFDNSAAIEKAIEPYLEDPDTEGIYLTVQGIDKRLFARSANELRDVRDDDTTKDKDIIYWNVFPIDVDDTDRPSKISATDEEILLSRETAIEIQDWFFERGIPSYRAMSSNGWHVLIYLEPERTTEENIILVKELGNRVHARWKIDGTVYNPARVFKLYGTISRKGSNTTDRKHRLSRIKLPIDLNEIQRVSLDQLTKVIEKELELPESNNREESNAKSSVKRKYSANTSKVKRFHGDSRDEWETYAAEVLGITGIGKWVSRSGYQLAKLDNCPFCDRESVNAHITYSSKGAPGIRCHSNSCHGKNLETLYTDKGIMKSEGKKKQMDKEQVESNDNSLELEIDRAKEVLGIDELPEPVVEKNSKNLTYYYYFDLKCPYHADCIGYIRISEIKGRIMPAYWACQTEQYYKKL